MHWIVQKNITNPKDIAAIQQACQSNGFEFSLYEFIPFSEDRPKFEGSNYVFYGSTSMMEQLYPHPGLFFDPNNFSMQNYIEQWGEKMLNAEAKLTNFETLAQASYAKDQLLFIRPDADSKSFSGTVLSFGEIQDWWAKLQVSDSTQLNAKTPIIAGPAYRIQREWRLWIVDQEIVTASLYAEDHRLKKQRGAPQEVLDFAQKAIESYQPHRIFVMDIAETGGEYYIIECGCMNSAGFYAADIEQIITVIGKKD